MSGAVVALSGGQDSTTCLHWALREFDGDVHAVSFDYGQRHRVELSLARRIADDAGVPHKVLTIGAFSELGAASLTNTFISNQPDGVMRNSVADERGLPQSFVPGRNIVFLSLAAAYGIQRAMHVVVTGICQADEAGYPDCRNDFRASLEYTIRLGTATRDFWLKAPLMHRTKAQTWALAEELGILDVIIRETNTCYEGDREILHPWGYGCGRCPACITRQNGWAEYRGQTTLA